MPLLRRFYGNSIPFKRCSETEKFRWDRTGGTWTGRVCLYIDTPDAICNFCLIFGYYGVKNYQQDDYYYNVAFW